MGIQGLRKFLESATPSASVPKGRSVEVDHLAIDLNCMIYQAYSKTHCTPKETIQSLLKLLAKLLDEVRPNVSLTIAVDGPAPVAKLPTQRLRRRKTQHMDTTNNSGHSELAISAGSPFLWELESSLKQFVSKIVRERRLVRGVVSGGAAAGEGESKVSQALLAFVRDEPRHYDPSHTVVIVGNDIDLALTALGLTPFVNISILSPSNMLYFDIGSLLYKWVGADQGFLDSLENLTSARIDFVFLFNLNGGDHFVGLGEAGADLWKRYRQMRQRKPHLTIVGTDLASIDLECLSEVLGSASYAGSCDPKIGATLLEASLWATAMTCTGNCSDFRYTASALATAPAGGPTFGHVHAAINSGQKRIVLPRGNSTPPTPLGTYIALMPSLHFQPKGIQITLQKNKQLCEKLFSGGTHGSVERLLDTVDKVLQATPESALTANERALLKQHSGTLFTVAKGKEQMLPFKATGFNPAEFSFSYRRVKELDIRSPFHRQQKRMTVTGTATGETERGTVKKQRVEGSSIAATQQKLEGSAGSRPPAAQKYHISMNVDV